MPRAQGGAWSAGHSAIALHLALAQQEPVDGDVLLQREGNEKIGMGGGSALVAVHVLLEYTQVARELPLRSAVAYPRQSFRELPLLTFDCSRGHDRCFSLLYGASDGSHGHGPLVRVARKLQRSARWVAMFPHRERHRRDTISGGRQCREVISSGQGRTGKDAVVGASWELAPLPANPPYTKKCVSLPNSRRIA